MERSRDLLACLGDASRHRIVERLAEGERCVTDLARDVALSQSCTTRHLQALQRAGLVAGTRAGKRVVFRLRLDDPAVDGLLRWMMSGAADAEAPRPRVKDPRLARPRTVAGAARPDGRPGERSALRAPGAPAAEAAPEALAAPREADPPEEEPRGRPYPARGQDLEDFLL